MSELTGIVAILSEGLDAIEEYRDLGPVPVAVKADRCWPVIDVKPELLDGQYHGEPIATLEAGFVRRTYPVVDLTVDIDDLNAERDSRLALGFDYDFGDDRGVHHIDTTPVDMIGWDEVSKLASALLAHGQSTPITIATGTGVTQVTPLEWQMVMLAAAAYRQPIWGASFMIAAMNPIPFDFTNDAYWEVSSASA